MRKASLVLTSLFILTTMIAVGCGESGQTERRAPIKRSPKANSSAGADRECRLATAKGVPCVAVQERGEESTAEIDKLSKAHLEKANLILKEAMPEGTYKLTNVFQIQSMNNADKKLIQTFAVQVESGQPPVLGNIEERRTPNAKNVETSFSTYNIPVLFEVKGGQVNVAHAMTVKSRFQKLTNAKASGDIIPGLGHKDKDHVFSQIATMKAEQNVYSAKLNGNSRNISIFATADGLILSEDRISGGTSKHFILTYSKVAGTAPEATPAPSPAAPAATSPASTPATPPAASPAAAAPAAPRASAPEAAADNANTAVVAEAPAVVNSLPAQNSAE